MSKNKSLRIEADEERSERVPAFSTGKDWKAEADQSSRPERGKRLACSALSRAWMVGDFFLGTVLRLD